MSVEELILTIAFIVLYIYVVWLSNKRKEPE